MFNPYDTKQAQQDAIDEVAQENEYLSDVKTPKLAFDADDKIIAEMSIPERNAWLTGVTKDFS